MRKLKLKRKLTIRIAFCITQNNAMKRNGRRIETFEPCGPIAQMIDNAGRGKARGWKTRFYEDCIAEMVGRKQPKLLEKYKVLREECAA